MALKIEALVAGKRYLSEIITGDFRPLHFDYV